MRRLVVFALVGLLVGCSGTARTTKSPSGPKAKTGSAVTAYRGLGTWVDVYDFLPAFQKTGEVPAVTVGSIADMSHLGIRTLYLQAAQDDPRSSGDIVEPRLVGDVLVAAHAVGMRVVAWYLPHFADVAADLRRIVALHDFRARGRGFDAIAIDIEWTRDVPDPGVRNERLVDLSQRVRAAVPNLALGAIVYPPVLLDTVNRSLWPEFPWRRLAPLYDVWLPMTYWTLRSSSSPYRDAGRYTSDNITALRASVDPAALVHPIGGIADAASARDDEAFVNAARAGGSIGWSTYDFDTSRSDAWPRLRAGS
jgi:uncharacterized lipoprotein YddW (UPF0748 family)